MKYLNEKTQTYLEDLRAKKSAPGGGAAAALTGAQGRGTRNVVAEFTIGNENYAQFEEACKGARAANSYVYANLAMLMDQDAEAYSKVAQARKMPENTEDEKAAEKAENRRSNNYRDNSAPQVANVPRGACGCRNDYRQMQSKHRKRSYNCGAESPGWPQICLAQCSYKFDGNRKRKYTAENFRKQGEMFLRLAAKIEKRAEEAGLFPDFNPPDEDDEVQQILKNAGWA